MRSLVEAIIRHACGPGPLKTPSTWYDAETIDAGLLVTSIGYRGMPVADLPYDEATGTIPNADGRVLDPATGAPLPGVYVVGWIKRGPTGFIGTNKSCSQDTVLGLVEDHNAGRLGRGARPRIGGRG